MSSRFALSLLMAILAAPTASACPPDSPQDLTASWAEGTIQLVWDDVDDATAYNVYRAGQLIGLSEAPNFTDSQPVAFAMYWVTAVNPDGESSPSNTAMSDPCAGPSSTEPYFYVNPENCEAWICEVIDMITP